MRDPGQMNRRIVLRTVTLTPDGGGGYDETPVDLPEIWAHVEPLQGNEQLQAMQTGMKRPHRFTVRYREGVTAATRVVYSDRVFDVTSVVDPDERHETLEILADEVIV
jgi:SPP1 family predicted phage head-tail adaptor